MTAKPPVDLYPLLFTPVLKDYIWGGRGLASRLGRDLPGEGVVAESWEIAAHEDGTTIVRNGPLAGRPLTELLAEYGLALIGARSRWALEREKFPLLIKLLDANRPLSVQVHPDDNYALTHEGNELGKTEMWVVLHAQPGAEVILGVKRGTTAADFRTALAEGGLEPLLHHIPVQTGDHINVPAGSLHAILGGLLIAEIQQNSNTTYRVYDWNRQGADGLPRPLHVEQALDVINFDQVEPAASAVVKTISAKDSLVRREILNETAYFTVERVSFAPRAIFSGSCQGETFEIWGVIEGQADLEADNALLELPAVTWVLLPAAMGAFSLSSPTGATLLRAYVA